MAKFRKKPVEVEAVLLTWSNRISLAEELDLHAPDNSGTLIIPTLEGDMTASVGDWIIRGVKGELYPCKPDVFEATYEEVED